ncbi:MAG: CoA-binding protein, partial [Deinococcales bacterium]
MSEDAIDDGQLRALLERARHIAILGASARPRRASAAVARYLVRHGYDVSPVNPRYAGESLHGNTTVASLTEVIEPVDVVDVFRRSEDLADLGPEILAMRPLPGAVWFQLGIRNDAVAATLRSRGITVVQDRCTM